MTTEPPPDFERMELEQTATEHVAREWHRFMRGARAEQIVVRYGWVLFAAGAIRAGFDLVADIAGDLGWPWLAFDIVSVVGLVALTVVAWKARRHSILRDQLNAARLLASDDG